MCVSRKQEFYDRIPDWIWPHLTGNPEPAPEYQGYFSAKHAGSLVEISSVLSSLIAQAEERTRTVDAKLVPLLTLTSLLSTAVAASLAAATTLGTVKEDAQVFAYLAVFLVFYVAMQILRSLWATVAGLMRKAYKQLSPAGIVPQDGEAGEAYRIRLLNLQANILCWNEWVVDQKVSDMAVAHTALRNALTAIFLIAVLALVMAVVNLAEVAMLPLLQ